MDWKKTVQNIIIGLIIAIVASVLSIFSFVATLKWLGFAALIVSYVFIFLGLNKFIKLVDPADAKAVTRVRLYYILAIVAVAVGIIPGLGWLFEGIIGLVAAILLVGAFAGLKKSATFPEIAKKGASLLFVAAILTLVAFALNIIIGWIPLVGGIVSNAMEVVALVLTFVGWNKIKNA